jgi:hypothetical protein
VAKQQVLSQEDLNSIKASVTYDPKTGKLFWKPGKRKTTFQLNDEAGWTRPDKYCHVCINYRAYQVHRVAWFLYHGEWPAKVIDHIDGNPSNNKIDNLRQVYGIPMWEVYTHAQFDTAISQGKTCPNIKINHLLAFLLTENYDCIRQYFCEEGV